MDKLIVALDPRGNQELGVAEMLNPELEDAEVYYLLVSGESDIPVLEDRGIELRMYQDAGYKVGGRGSLWHMKIDNKIPSFPCEDEQYGKVYRDTAIKMYRELGYTVDHIPYMVMISPL
jgi:hypothetical protein